MCTIENHYTKKPLLSRFFLKFFDKQDGILLLMCNGIARLSCCNPFSRMLFNECTNANYPTLRAIVLMKLWFCETCGKRVTEDDLAQDKARDKQAKGVYCAACAVGVQTTSFDAIDLPPATPSTVGEPIAVAAVRPSRPRTAPDSLRQRSAPPRGQPKSNKAMLAVIGAGVLIVLGGIVLLMKSGGNAAPPQDTTASVKHDAGANIAAAKPPAPITNEVPKTKNPAPVQPTPATDGGPDNKAQALNAEQQAETAFDKLQKALAALPEQDKAGRIALAEAFVKEHGDAIVAGRARAMISKWREPAAPAPTVVATPAAEKSPADTAAGIPQGFTSLLGKDLSNWTITSENKDCSIVDGALVLGPGFRGRLDTPIKLKNFVLEIEFSFEDKTGGGIEFQTALGSVAFDRTSAGGWNTVQINAHNGKLNAKLTSGKGDLQYNDGRMDDDILRIYTFQGAKKNIRAIRIAEIKP